MDNKLWIDALQEAMVHVVNLAPYNAIVSGFVTGVLGENRYRVSINGNEYDLPCTNADAGISTGQKVNVMIQNNDFNKAIIQAGPTAANTANSTKLERVEADVAYLLMKEEARDHGLV